MQYVPRNWENKELAQEVKEISKSVIEYLIAEWIVGKNAERDRKILKRRLIDGVRYEPLAEEFELSVRQVKNIVYKGESIIFKHA